VSDNESLEILMPVGPDTAQNRPIPRKLRKLIERLGDGDHCMGCRREYRDRDVTWVGRDAKRRLRQVGECCADKLVSVVAFSMYFVPKPAEVWSADDRDWFAAHPDRSHRLREAFPGEFSADFANCSHVVVEQMEPGARMRVPMSPELLEAGDPPEEAIWAIFELVREAQKKGEAGVRMGAILERWRTMQRAGRS
jgi:hypothetical protein